MSIATACKSASRPKSKSTNAFRWLMSNEPPLSSPLGTFGQFFVRKASFRRTRPTSLFGRARAQTTLQPVVRVNSPASSIKICTMLYVSLIKRESENRPTTDIVVTANLGKRFVATVTVRSGLALLVWRQYIEWDEQRKFYHAAALS